jgi:hypothetical protein
MLFLYNHTVLEVHDPYQVARENRVPNGTRSLADLTVTKLRILIGRVAVEAPELELRHADKAIALAALVLIKTNANAMRILVPDRVTSLSDVTLRFGSVSIVTMVQLLKLQQGGRLTPARCHQMVWNTPSSAT